MEQEWLSKGDLDRFRSILASRVVELEGALRCRERLAVEHNPDHLDEVQQASDRALVISNFDGVSRQLRDARDAISRLRHGSFGMCEQCGGKIHRRRLLAVPWAAFCIQCQEELDRERQRWTEPGWTSRSMRAADAA